MTTELDELEARAANRLASYLPLLALVRGLVGRYGGSDTVEMRAARSWLASHCRGCGCEIDPRRGSCGPCLKTWRRHSAPANQ